MERLRDIRETAEYLGISVNTLYGWVSCQRIPCYKVGRLVKFSPEEVDEWLKKHRRESNPRWEEIDERTVQERR